MQPAQFDAVLACGDRHRGGDAGAERGRDEIGRGERLAHPLVVLGRVSVEHAARGPVTGGAVEVTLVFSGDLDHGPTLAAGGAPAIARSAADGNPAPA